MRNNYETSSTNDKNRISALKYVFTAHKYDIVYKQHNDEC